MNPENAMTEVARITDRAGAAACFGDPITAGERTVIPVAEASYGFGFGWGGGGEPDGHHQSGAGGAGGGAKSRGIAVIEVSGEGVRVLPIEDQTALRLAGITLATTTTAIVARTLLKLIRG